jgi:hypothetical protein
MQRNLLFVLVLSSIFAQHAAQPTSCLANINGKTPYKQSLMGFTGYDLCASYCFTCSSEDGGCTEEQKAARTVIPIFVPVSASLDAQLKQYQGTDSNPYCKYSSCSTNDCQDVALSCPTVVNKANCLDISKSTTPTSPTPSPPSPTVVSGEMNAISLLACSACCCNIPKASVRPQATSTPALMAPTGLTQARSAEVAIPRNRNRNCSCHFCRQVG